jgi:hypothetical protein
MWGCVGSVGIELVTLLQLYQRPNGRLPARYHRVGFWIVRTLLVALAGMLAVALQAPSPQLAIACGVSTPLILHRAAETGSLT